MNVIKTYITTVLDENNILHTLNTSLIRENGIYGFECTLSPANSSARDCTVPDDKTAALEIFDILCKEKVLPLNLCSVLDDLSDMYMDS